MSACVMMGPPGRSRSRFDWPRPGGPFFCPLTQTCMRKQAVVWWVHGEREDRGMSRGIKSVEVVTEHRLAGEHSETYYGVDSFAWEDGCLVLVGGPTGDGSDPDVLIIEPGARVLRINAVMHYV